MHVLFKVCVLLIFPWLEWEDRHELLYPGLFPLYYERTRGASQGIVEQHGKFWFILLGTNSQRSI